jgi:hypothetical protein
MDAVRTAAPKKLNAAASELETLPISYQQINDYFQNLKEATPFNLRKETFLRIEAITGRPLICYVAKTSDVGPGVPIAIDHSDLIGFTDLAHAVPGKNVDIFLQSNGGSPEAAERIVRFLRERFDSIRFIISGNAYSAATLISFSGDTLIMSATGTLGPIDPQIKWIPARAILRGFENVEKEIVRGGAQSLNGLCSVDLEIRFAHSGDL